MNPEQQRIAIAEACGWSHKALCNETYWWHDENNKSLPLSDDGMRVCPDYLHDLNAMHEAESILNADQMVSYDYHLDLMVGNGRQGLNIEYFLWSATATQRAEAFLRTIGKWEENQ